MTQHSRDYEIAETERRLEKGQSITLLIGLVIGVAVAALVFWLAF